jgi:hypothetical protein
VGKRLVGNNRQSQKGAELCPPITHLPADLQKLVRTVLEIAAHSGVMLFIEPNVFPFMAVRHLVTIYQTSELGRPRPLSMTLETL